MKGRGKTLALIIMAETENFNPQDLAGSLQLFAASVVEGFITGLHKSPFHGYSAEFSEHRLFNTGDSLKTVDWKLYGRTDKLFVKRFEEETNLRCQIIMDASASMGFPQGGESKLQFACRSAAVLAELLSRQKDAVGLSILGSGINPEIQAASRASHKKHLMELLAALEPGKEKHAAGLAENLHLLAERLPRRSMVIILSDLMEDMGDSGRLAAAFRHLRHARHEVIVFHIQHSELEALLAFPDRPTRFVDLETGVLSKLNPLDVRENYMRAFAAWSAVLADCCSQNGIDYFRANVQAGYVPVLRAWLVKRQKRR